MCQNGSENLLDWGFWSPTFFVHLIMIHMHTKFALLNDPSLFFHLKTYFQQHMCHIDTLEVLFHLDWKCFKIPDTLDVRMRSLNAFKIHFRGRQPPQKITSEPVSVRLHFKNDHISALIHTYTQYQKHPCTNIRLIASTFLLDVYWCYPPCHLSGDSFLPTERLHLHTFSSNETKRAKTSASSL